MLLEAAMGVAASIDKLNVAFPHPFTLEYNKYYFDIIHIFKETSLLQGNKKRGGTMFF